jgi:hypothetical protein
MNQKQNIINNNNSYMNKSGQQNNLINKILKKIKK